MEGMKLRAEVAAPLAVYHDRRSGEGESHHRRLAGFDSDERCHNHSSAVRKKACVSVPKRETDVFGRQTVARIRKRSRDERSKARPSHDDGRFRMHRIRTGARCTLSKVLGRDLEAMFFFGRGFSVFGMGTPWVFEGRVEI